jgi:hypothetical protein
MIFIPHALNAAAFSKIYNSERDPDSDDHITDRILSIRLSMKRMF